MRDFEKTIDKEQLLTILDTIKQAVTASQSKTIKLDDMSIELPAQFTCEFEYEEEKGQAELELEFKWPVEDIDSRSEAQLKHSGCFELFQGKDQKWYFHLRAANHQIILVSQGYSVKESAKQGIESVKKHAHIEHFENRLSKANQPFFVLKAKNGGIIGTSQMYRRKCGCGKGVRSVILHASQAPVIET